jgi:hypothetical protein
MAVDHRQWRRISAQIGACAETLPPFRVGRADREGGHTPEPQARQTLGRGLPANCR